jgi:hypothetical protein
MTLVSRLYEWILINHFFFLGIGTGEFNINDENLSSELGIVDTPSLCVISQGRVYHFNDEKYSEIVIKEFVRKSIPIKRFIKTVKTCLFLLMKILFNSNF